MSSEIQLYSVPDLQLMAKAMATTGMFGFKRPEEAFALMLIAQAEGKHPATIAQDYDIIQGRPALKSVAALSRFQHAGGSIQWEERSNTVARATFRHKLGGEVAIEWTIKRAQDAKLTGKDNWVKFPAQMLSARVVAEGVRACFPACLNGFYLVEEQQDFEPRQEPRKASARALVEVSQAPPVDAVDQGQITELLMELKECGVTRDEIDAVMQGGKLKEMTRAQYDELAQVVHVIRSRATEPGAAESAEVAE